MRRWVHSEWRDSWEKEVGLAKKKKTQRGDWNPLGMHKERKHLGWLNSSQSLQQKNGGGVYGGESASARHYVLQYISNSGVSVLKVLTNLLRSVVEGCEGLKVKE